LVIGGVDSGYAGGPMRARPLSQSILGDAADGVR